MMRTTAGSWKTWWRTGQGLPGKSASACWLLLVVLVLGEVWTARAVAATVSIHPFGRYEMMLQEGVPIDTGEILGMVRRKTGLPDYPLMWGRGRASLDLNLLGPGNRPIRIASAEGSGSAVGRQGPLRIIIERASVRGESLILDVRLVGRSRRGSLRIDLPRLERMLEGER